ncbi:MFS transporter [Paraburkholderia caribensis]|uniref:MFS transporter n=1 Tax=Paraburkholderia caribensis TaxID=75105 RepID=UPI001CB4F747|nr:MFS transporter [Paraburkholderia caribensis]CAG9263164.1 Putative tartrate transporter [Paraburkholderia caribensis]
MYELTGSEAQQRAEPEDQITRETYRRVTRRLFPLFLICYTLAYLDRVNIGFAQLQMQRDLMFSAAVYGLGAGIFFIGYVSLEVPSNLLLRKIGARKTLTRIMMLWGVISASMMFVKTPGQFYVLRLMLGMAEAGFFPGMVLYFTYWYPRRRRAAMINVATLGTCVAGVGGGIVSGVVMRYCDGMAGLAGWQWMFLVEGVPAVLMGVVTWFVMSDGPESVAWLSESQKVLILEDLRSDEGSSTSFAPVSHEAKNALRRPGLYVLSLIYFCLNAAIYTLGFWIPTIIKGFNVTDVFMIGLYTSIPYAFGAIAMFFMTRSSDRRRERRWHFAVSMTMGALALVLLTFTTANFTASMCLVTIAFPLIFGCLPIFWATASSWLGESIQAFGLAFVSSLGSIGAFVSPAVLGWIKTETGSLSYGFYLVALVMLLAAGLMLLAISRASLAERDGQSIRR